MSGIAPQPFSTTAGTETPCRPLPLHKNSSPAELGAAWAPLNACGLQKHWELQPSPVCPGWCPQLDSLLQGLSLNCPSCHRTRNGAQQVAGKAREHLTTGPTVLEESRALLHSPESPVPLFYLRPWEGQIVPKRTGKWECPETCQSCSIPEASHHWPFHPRSPCPMASPPCDLEREMERSVVNPGDKKEPAGTSHSHPSKKET